jgi:hypothetical protein
MLLFFVKTIHMRKLITTLSIILFLSSSSFAQLFNVGVKAGVSMHKITGKSFSEEFSYGYHVGGYVDIGLGKKFSIQPELLFNQVNTDTSNSFSSVYPSFNKVNNIQLKYLSIPLVLSYKVANILSLQAGPQFGVLIDQEKNLVQNGEEAFKKGDFSLLGGVQVKLTKLRVYGRYVVGLSDVNNIGDRDKWKNQSLQFGVGIGL